MPNPMNPIFISPSALLSSRPRKRGPRAGATGWCRPWIPAFAGMTDDPVMMYFFEDRASDRPSKHPRLFLLEHILRHECRGHCRRPAGVESQVRDDLAELILGDAIVERPL